MLILLFLFVTQCFGYVGVDTVTEVTKKEIQCIQSLNSVKEQGGLKFMVVRVFDSDNGVDKIGLNNLQVAHDNGLEEISAYMTPCVNCSTNYTQQLSAVLTALKAKGVPSISTLWLNLNGRGWSDLHNVNQKVISELLAFGQTNGQTMGVFVSASTWSRLVGSWGLPQNDVLLWLLDANGEPSYAGYKKFGDWDDIKYKKYTNGTTTCGITIGFDCVKYRYEWLSYFSAVIGWIYFTAWTISFFPQLILNYQRKSVVGLSFEFLMYNLTGFLFYTTYTITTYVVERKYELAFAVQTNDICFAIIAVLLTAAQCVQCFIYERGNQKLNKVHLAICVLLWFMLAVHAILAAAGVIPWFPIVDNDNSWTVMLFMGVVKSFISGIKQVPQVYLNFIRKSTVGWSIINILLDFTGGSLSFSQNFIDGYNKNNWAIFTGNIPKLLLSCVTIMFDIIFMTQHYCIYTDRTDHDARSDTERLLTSESKTFGDNASESFDSDKYNTFRKEKPINSKAVV